MRALRSIIMLLAGMAVGAVARPAGTAEPWPPDHPDEPGAMGAFPEQRPLLAAPAFELPSIWGELARSVPALIEVLKPGPCLAVGWPAFGRLENGLRARSTPGLFVRSRDSWGTPETVGALRRAAQEVEALYPGRGDLVVTDISRRDGGFLKPHRTHQNGQDVDVLLYKRAATEGGRKPRSTPGMGARNPGDWDLERTWALISLLRRDDRDDRAELVLMDRGLQQMLLAYARDVVGVPPAELERTFQRAPGGKGRDTRTTFLRHAPKHRTHLHIRFRSPEALLAAAAQDARRGVERLMHVAARKETLESVAAQYGTTPAEIARENRLGKRTRLRRGERLFILRPLAGQASLPTAPPPGGRGG